MKKINVLCLLFILSIVFSFSHALCANSAVKNEERPIKVFVYGKVEPNVVRAGRPIPLTITISNGLRVPIYHSTFSLEPNDWNGETMNISLSDIYRNDKMGNLYLYRPTIDCPDNISGPGRNTINAGSSLSIRTDAQKWKLRDGWLPGRYKMTLRVDNLTIDEYCKLSILSDPIEFEIK